MQGTLIAMGRQGRSIVREEAPIAQQGQRQGGRDDGHVSAGGGKYGCSGTGNSSSDQVVTLLEHKDHGCGGSVQGDGRAAHLGQLSLSLLGVLCQRQQQPLAVFALLCAAMQLLRTRS